MKNNIRSSSTNTNTDINTDTNRDTNRDRDTDRDTNRDTNRVRDMDMNRDTNRDTNRVRDTDTATITGSSHPAEDSFYFETIAHLETLSDKISGGRPFMRLLPTPLGPPI